MAIRNLQAINNRGEMIAQQKRNKMQMKEDNFWNRVEIVRSSHDDAVDAIDTIEYLYKNGMRQLFEDWNKGKGVYYESQYKQFKVYCNVKEPSRETSYVAYRPYDDSVHFSWNGYGMCEDYDVGSKSSQSTQHFIHTYLDKKGYDGGLTDLSVRLQPFLNAFFKWVETL